MLHLLTPQKDRRKTGLCTEMEFRTVIEREQARADRYGSEFSLVEIGYGDSNDPHDNSRKLIYTLLRRARSTDSIGWFAQKSIGVLLPATDQKGAEKLARDISEHYRSERKFLYAIHSYQPRPKDDENKKNAI